MAGGTRGTVQAVEDCENRVGQIEDRWVEYQRNMESYMQQMNQHIADSKQQMAKSDANAVTVATLLETLTRRLANIEDNPQSGQGGREQPNSRPPPMTRENLVERDLPAGREPTFGEADDEFFPRGRERDNYMQRQPPVNRQSNTSNHVRMEMPNFNGENPRAWLYKAERYFQFYDLDDHQKFIIASVHLDGPALTWFESVESNNQLRGWAHFRRLVTQRFGPSPFQDLHGDLAKLQQLSTVKQFFSDFEELTNQLPGIPEHALQSYFISGLRPEIAQEVRTLQPTTLVHAFQLARMVEDRMAYVANMQVRRPARVPYQPPAVMPALLPPPHRRDVTYNVGDQVLVKLQPYRQHSLTDRSYVKLLQRYYGPYEVLKVIGKTAFKLNLPDSSRIHPVFHVSRLKLFREDANLHPNTLPPTTLDGKLVVPPLAILRRRWVMSRTGDVLQFLVQWQGCPKEDATWVTEADFIANFADFDLGDKVSLETGGNDTNAGTVYTRQDTRTRKSGQARGGPAGPA